MHDLEPDQQRWSQLIDTSQCILGSIMSSVLACICHTQHHVEGAVSMRIYHQLSSE